MKVSYKPYSSTQVFQYYQQAGKPCSGITIDWFPALDPRFLLPEQWRCEQAMVGTCRGEGIRADQQEHLLSRHQQVHCVRKYAAI